MRRLSYKIKDQPITINVVEDENDLDGFIEFIRRNPVVGFDTETTGVEIYSNNFKVRVAQFGNATESWVLPVERSAKMLWFAAKALEHVEHLVIQNASFDIPVVARHWGLDMRMLFGKTTDTKILAKLIDPRSTEVGGTGDSLEDLTKAYIDEATAEDVKALATREARKLRVTKGEYFTQVSIHDENYLLYAGMDPVLTYRLGSLLRPKVPPSARRLIEFEHELQRICSEVSHRGYLLDREYSRKLSSRLRSTETRQKNIALGLGVENVNSNEQVIAALKEHGWTEFGRTEKGAESVDKHVLSAAMASKDKDIARLARAVSEAKRAGKWRETWVDKFLATADADGYCHPSINTLQARTGRMSITGIPAQTLPAGEASIRHCFIAEEGHVTLSTDYRAQELRVLAALAGDQVMLDAFREGADLHQVTADAAGVGRQAGKGTNFSVVFGGGWRAVHTQFGVSEEDSKRAVDTFWKTYKGVERFAKEASNKARRAGYVTTASGRRLPIDKDRPYAATNALVQSTARDVTGRGLIRLDEAGVTPFIRLPIHDEVVFSVPSEDEESAARMTNELMQEEMNGLMISTEAEAMGRSWGSLYESPDDNRKYVLEN